MKKILLVAIALGFVFAGNFETFAQKRTVSKKTVKRKLVKCRVNGKIVYRTKCRTETPLIAPSTTIDRIESPTMVTQGNGQGGGTGNGDGNVLSSGAGLGNGAGYGTGTGDIDRRTTVTPQTRVIPQITRNLVITSKPRAIYTDEARKNNVAGTVRLRVQFLANGQIGTITPVNNLPYGLTENAKAAARGIRFEPAMRNGKPYTVVRIIEYSFTIY